MKKCSTCKEQKALGEFNFEPKANRHSSRCKACLKIHRCRQTPGETAEYRERSKLAAQDTTLRRRYGISANKRDEVFSAQGGVCAICLSTESRGKGWHVDHCHTTNEVRGILCNGCNVGLGYFKESLPALSAAINYLKGDRVTVKLNLLKSEPGERAFCKQFNLTRVHFQRTGTAFDAECPHTGRRYELKVDTAASRTGNVFIETAYSADGGQSWADSGFNLARKQAQAYVIKVGTEYIFCECPVLETFLLENNFRVAATRAGANGNALGAHARGLIVPVVRLRGIAYEITAVEE